MQKKYDFWSEKAWVAVITVPKTEHETSSHTDFILNYGLGSMVGKGSSRVMLRAKLEKGVETSFLAGGNSWRRQRSH